ncbi:sodium:solute symporter family transporter [Adhaeribacter arboris]|nr:sodium transporter [Adhaeribacter arboris]
MKDSLQLLDYSAIGIYMVLMGAIGLFLGRYVKNINDYFVGDNSIPPLGGAISNFMSLFSTFVFVAYAGIAYEYGLVAILILWSSVPPALIAAKYFAHRWRRAGLITPMQFLETRYNAPVRQILSWGGIGFKILDSLVRLYSIGLFIAAATPLSLETAILVSGLIVVLYTVLGGIWAVVVTDAVQFVILIFSTLILLPLSIKAVGGLDNLTLTIPAHFTFFNGPKGTPLFLLGYYVMVLIKYNGNWAFIQRFYSVRDEAAGAKMGLITAAFFFVFPVVFLIPAIAARSYIPDLADKEMAYVSMCLRLLPEGIMGVMIAAMFAATMSALSATYNVVAGVLTEDIYKRLISPYALGRNLLLVARGSTFLIGILVTFGALYIGNFGGAFEANKLFTGLFAIPMSIPLLMGILYRRPKPWGALVTIVAGIIIGLILNQDKSISWEAATLLQIVICILIMVVSGWVPSKNPTYEARVNTFFKKLATPISAAEKPVVNEVFMRSLKYLFAIAMSTTAVLFLTMSLPSITKLSGQLSFGAGTICLIGAGILWVQAKSKDKKAISALPEPEAITYQQN